MTSDFRLWKKLSMWALSVGLAGRFMLCTIPTAARRVRNSKAAYSMPRSLWKINPSPGGRLAKQ